MSPLCKIDFEGGAAWAQQAPVELAGALAAAGEKRLFASGRRLFSFGEAAGGVFLILKGRARAVLAGEPGRELLSLTTGPGSLLGVPSALCAKNYQFDVQAVETLEAVYLPAEQLNELLRLRPELGIQVMSMMCEELSALGRTREHLSRCQNKECGLHGYCSHEAAAPPPLKPTTGLNGPPVGYCSHEAAATTPLKPTTGLNGPPVE